MNKIFLGIVSIVLLACFVQYSESAQCYTCTSCKDYKEASLVDGCKSCIKKVQWEWSKDDSTKKFESIHERKCDKENECAKSLIAEKSKTTDKDGKFWAIYCCGGDKCNSGNMAGVSFVMIAASALLAHFIR